MELVLEKSLEHQQNAVDAVADVFAGVRINPPTQYYANPVLDPSDPQVFGNIAAVQVRRGVPPEMRGATTVPHDCLPLDVKMETGTGKTYVYTKTIFELHRRYGFNKFIVAVPSLAIKAGTSQFMTDGVARKHFADVCGYDATLDVQVLEAVKAAKKSRRESFPAAVWEFVKATKEARRRISVLVVNMQLLSNAKMLEKEYDSMFENMRRPFDALRSTRPIVVIDEPHRFERTQKAYEKIEKEICPQCVIRYGATFPETKLGAKKGQPKPKDYRNLLYDLNACKAFNDGLVKGINKEHLESPEGGDELVKLISTETHLNARFQRVAKGKPTKTVEVRQGDSLGLVHEAFEGIEVAEIGANAVTLSNGLVRKLNDPIAAGPHLKSYQDGMLQLAIDRHFETERENFRRGTKIKTLALFFISDIRSYRDKDGYLRERFERYLREGIEKTLAALTPSENDYRAFLEVSAANLSLCHGGYFSKDKTAADEATVQEVEEILFGKKQLLSFKDASGNWNVRRFLFSKWTLREGWDNPNVFTIAKLRSCGSETSLLQEVGRGLRLPVDENGNRVSGEDFRLNYIVDFTEADFAERLVGQINAEVVTFAVITEEKLNEVAKKRGISADDLFDELRGKGYIDRKMNIVEGKHGALVTDYPEFGTGGVRRGAIKDRNKKKEVRVRVRKEQFAALKRLWEMLNQRYVLYFDMETGEMLEKALPSIWEMDVFAESTLMSRSQSVKATASGMMLAEGRTTQYGADRRLGYGEFLKRLFAATRVPVRKLHESLCLYARAHGEPMAEHFTETTVVNFKNALDDWKVANLQGRIHYERASVPVVKTELTNADGSVVADVAQGRIGRHLAEGDTSAKYLYDAKAYDSDLELEDICCDSVCVPEVDSVTVYGKIPTKSVAIPTIMGGTYSPDFMYVVKRKGGKSELNVVIEVKDVEKDADLHKSEAMKIKCAEVFYDMLRKDGIDVRYQKQLKNQKLADIIAQVIEKVDAKVEIKCDVPETDRFKTYLPLYSTVAKCGQLASGQAVTQDGWVKVEGHGRLDETQFVVKAEGDSMTGLVEDGEYCVMRRVGGGNLENKTVLVQEYDAAGAEGGGAYALKKFTRKGKQVVLVSRNPSVADIVLEDDAEYSDKYRVIAEFKHKL